jgi:hypothetical protein
MTDNDNIAEKIKYNAADNNTWYKEQHKDMCNFAYNGLIKTVTNDSKNYFYKKKYSWELDPTFAEFEQCHQYKQFVDNMKRNDIVINTNFTNNHNKIQLSHTLVSAEKVGSNTNINFYYKPR